MQCRIKDIRIITKKAVAFSHAAAFFVHRRLGNKFPAQHIILD